MILKFLISVLMIGIFVSPRDELRFPGKPVEGELTAFDQLSRPSQRYLLSVASCYYTDHLGNLWTNKLEVDGIGDLSKMNEDVAAGRLEAFTDESAPRWYYVRYGGAFFDRASVLGFLSRVTNATIHDERRAFIERQGGTYFERILVERVYEGRLYGVAMIDGAQEAEHEVIIDGYPYASSLTTPVYIDMHWPVISMGEIWVGSEVRTKWRVDRSKDLRADFPLTDPAEYGLYQLTPHELAQILSDKSITELPEWKLVRETVREATPGRVRTTRHKINGVGTGRREVISEGRSAEYMWRFDLRWKTITWDD